MSSPSRRGPNGSAKPVNGNGKSRPTNGTPAVNGHTDASAGEIPADEPAAPEPMEYYILCPQRPTEVPGLITHLISRDICEKRQAENYHKCPNCIRARIWREHNGLKPNPAAAAR
jgi:hypothetical protein